MSDLGISATYSYYRHRQQFIEPTTEKKNTYNLLGTYNELKFDQRE